MKAVTRADYQRRIERVTRALAAEPARTRTLDELARLAHFSPFHFHRVYRAMVGESVAETARRFRIEKGALLLAASDSPVTAIAMDAGYESVQTFSRAFRSVTSLSPTCFRNRKIRFADLVDGPRPPRRPDPRIEVEIVSRSAVKVWALRHRGPMTRAAKTFSRLWQWQIDNGIAGRTNEAMGICYGDGEVGDAGFRYYAAIVWDEPIEADERIERMEVPAGKYANYRLVGHHDGIPRAFERLYGEWLPSSGYLPDERPALEIYRNNPFDTSANNLITDLLLPVR